MKLSKSKTSTLAAMICIVLAAISCTIVGLHYGKQEGANELASHIYPKSGIVTHIMQDEDVIIIEDFTGHEWVWEGVEDWQEGDIAAMIMDDNGTDIITDDIIMDVTYQGYTEG